ncbi:hypothetical protein BVRB_9g215680 [Beta vulgaris subsp. vulgaris]|nr:hypothetical protein BVRB_9g215680 [Beta vulgaris subsp. vulgaris]
MDVLYYVASLMPYIHMIVRHSLGSRCFFTSKEKGRFGFCNHE